MAVDGVVSGLWLAADLRPLWLPSRRRAALTAFDGTVIDLPANKENLAAFTVPAGGRYPQVEFRPGTGHRVSCREGGVLTVVHKHASGVATTGPTEMISRLGPDLIEAYGMLRYVRTVADALVLRTALAQMSAIIADELSVLGSIGPARSWYATAMAAADRTQSSRLRAGIRALEAMLPLYHGRQAAAIQLTQQAQGTGDNSASFATSLAPMLEALACARLGNHERATAALRQARVAHDQMDDTEKVESIFGFSARRRLFYEGRLLTIIGDYAAAEAAHRQARELYPPQVVGDRAIMDIDRATALIHLNEVDAGANLISTTLTNLPDDHRTGIFLTLAARALDATPAQARRRPAPRECAELLDTLSTS